MYGNGVARQMEAWHREHNGRSGDPEWQAFLDDFRQGMSLKHEEWLDEHSNAGRFGMSKAGGCTRAAALKYLGEEAEPFSGSTRATFFLGHICEIITICTLRAIGLEVQGMQEPVTIDPFMHSYSDGIITAFNGGPAVLSVKSAGYKKSGKERRGSKFVFVRRGFPELPFEGVRKAQPGHWAQAQAEMHGYHLAGEPIYQTLYAVMSKDIIKAMEEDPYLGDGDGMGNGSLAFYTETILYDQAWCESVLVPTWAAQWEHVKNGSAGPGMYLPNADQKYTRLKTGDLSWKPNADLTGTFNPCAYCDLHSACQSRLASDWRRG